MSLPATSKPSSFGQRVFSRWADAYGLQAFVICVISSLAIIGYYDPGLLTRLFSSPEIASEESEQSLDQLGSALSDEDVERHQRVDRYAIPQGECIVVLVAKNSSEGIFTQANIRAVNRVVSAVESLPQVRRVSWIDNVPTFNVFGLTGTLLPSENASDRMMDLGRQRVLSNPLAVGQLISEDGQTLLIHVSLDWFYISDDAMVATELRETAEKVLAGIPNAEFDVLVTGRVPLQMMMSQQHVTNSFKYQLIGYSIMAIAALVLFRGFSAVLIVFMAPACGVFWTMAAVRYLDLQNNPFNDIIVPVLVSLVGLTDAVHLMVEIRNQRAVGLSTSQASRIGVSRVGMACFLTSLTTAIGFLALMNADHKVVKEFGWCCAIGVGMTFTSVLTVIPLACRSPLGRRLHVGVGKSLVDAQLRRIGPLVDWVLRRDRMMAWSAIVITVLLAMVTLQLTPDEKRFSGLSENGEAARGLRHLDSSLGGLEFSYINVSWSEDNSDSEVLAVLEQVNDWVASEPLLGRPVGLFQLLEALPGDGDASEKMAILDILPPGLKRAFYFPEARYATLQFRIRDLGIAAYDDTFRRMQDNLTRIAGEVSGVEISIFGDAYWRWENVYRIVNDLAKSLGTASIIICGLLIVFYRSIRIGIISIVPNTFPLVATGAMLVLFGQHLEMVTVCVFTICLGIAVDDTIHFLTRYQEEMAEGELHKVVIRKAFTGVGMALLMTTIVLVTGMGSAIVGDSRDARLFGIMGCITLTTALLGDIFFLPALLSQFAKRPQNANTERLREMEGKEEYPTHSSSTM